MQLRRPKKGETLDLRPYEFPFKGGYREMVIVALVLQDHPSWLNFAEQPNDFEEETAARSSESWCGARIPAGATERDVLAREPGRDAVDLAELIASDRSHVFKTFRGRKSISKDSPVDLVDLDLPLRFPACFFEAEIEPTDPGKKAPDRPVNVRSSCSPDSPLCA